MSKKFATLAATAVFVIPFLHQKQSFLESHFWQEIITLTCTIRGGMKFATQISPLLNLYYVYYFSDAKMNELKASLLRVIEAKKSAVDSSQKPEMSDEVSSKVTLQGDKA